MICFMMSVWIFIFCITAIVSHFVSIESVSFYQLNTIIWSETGTKGYEFSQTAANISFFYRKL